MTIPQRLVAPLRWTIIAAAVAAVAFLHRYVPHINPTTVALALLLIVLSVAARWGLRYGVAVSLISALCYNFFFLPPIGSWLIAEAHNWVALLAFLATSVIGSRLSTRIREEAEEAKRREHEVEVLFHLSRELLQTDNVVELLRTMPDSIARATGSASVALYLDQGQQFYRAGVPADRTIEQSPEELMRLPCVTRMHAGATTVVPLRTGLRQRGVLLLGPSILSDETLEALGGLASIAIDRVQALETAARSEAAKESERLRSLMLDSITHELRTPLTAIKASSTAMLSSAALNPEDRHELLTVIDEETDRLNRLIAQAVQMAQLDTHEIHMNLLPAVLEDLVRQCVRGAATALAGRPVAVSSDAASVRVLADSLWLQRAFTNLIENSAKYSPAGSPVTIAITAGAETASVRITDRGVGIPVSEQVLIFEKFYRGREQLDRRPGTGMGLAICRAIVEAHHGSIHVESAPGEGSTFTVELPVWRGGTRPSHS